MDLELLNQLSTQQLFVAIGVAGFLVGGLIAMLLGGAFRGREDGEDPRNHTIRSLEADLRTAQREISELRSELEDKTEEFNTSVATLQELRVTMSEREQHAEELEADLKESVRKTRELRV